MSHSNTSSHTQCHAARPPYASRSSEERKTQCHAFGQYSICSLELSAEKAYASAIRQYIIHTYNVPDSLRMMSLQKRIKAYHRLRKHDEKTSTQLHESMIQTYSSTTTCCRRMIRWSGRGSSSRVSSRSNTTPGRRLRTVPRSATSASSLFRHSCAAIIGSRRGGEGRPAVELRVESAPLIRVFA